MEDKLSAQLTKGSFLFKGKSIKNEGETQTHTGSWVTASQLLQYTVCHKQQTKIFPASLTKT